MALVVALLVLMVLSLLATVLISSVQLERKVSSQGQRAMTALNCAEAGIGEAISRLRNGDAPDDGNPRRVTQIFLTVPGGVPVTGTDTTALNTSQPAGQWLSYSTGAKGPDVLTIEYKTDPARTVIYRFDNTRNPAIQTVSGRPIFRITSVGHRGRASATIITEVTSRPMIGDARAATLGWQEIKYSEDCYVCGFNHRADTPTGTAAAHGRNGAPWACNENPGLDHWEVGYRDLPGGLSGGKIDGKSSSQQSGDPPVLERQASGMYAGPWELLDMDAGAFYSWLGNPRASAPGSLHGITHLDNDGVRQNRSGTFSIPGGDGAGMIYVDGDLRIDGDLTFRGVIYVEGQLRIDAHLWVLGTVVAGRKLEINSKDVGSAVLYSSDAIEENLSKYGNEYTTLSWREIN